MARNKNGSDIDEYHRYHIYFYISGLIKIRIRICVGVPCNPLVAPVAAGCSSRPADRSFRRPTDRTRPDAEVGGHRLIYSSPILLYAGTAHSGTVVHTCTAAPRTIRCRAAIPFPCVVVVVETLWLHREHRHARRHLSIPLQLHHPSGRTE